MNYFIFFAGIIIVSFVIANVFVSTLATRGARFFTERLLRWVWNFFYWVAKGKGRNKILNYAGFATLIILLIVWIFIFWIGNALIFIAQPDSIVNTGTMAVASVPEKIYFVGYVLSTLGLGDFKPFGSGWMIYTSVISFFGFIMISTVVSYLISVSAGEIQKRKVSGLIHSLGSSPQNILLNSWNGKDFSRLSKHFSQLTSLILEVAQQHTAYPVLHNFHANLVRESFSVNIASLDEALTILLLYKPKEILPATEEIYSVRYAITEYLASLKKAFIKPSENIPSPVHTQFMKENEIPVQNDKQTEIKLQRLRYRRSILLGMLENDGWNMDSLYKSKKLYREYDF